jgi:hypothetical protein
MAATASHQSTPSDSILKMSRVGAILVHLWDAYLYQSCATRSVTFGTVCGRFAFSRHRRSANWGSSYWEIVALRAVEHMKRLKCRFDLTTGTGALPGLLRLRYDTIWVAPTLMHYISLNLGMREGVSAFRTLYKPLRHLTGTYWFEAPCDERT